ncbi:MAG: thioredoxin [bacterium]
MAEITLTDATFENEILKSSGVALVDFWAPWCGPCRVVGPVVEEIATEFTGKAKVGKVNVDENPDTAGQFGVMSIPTLIIFKDGKEVDKIIGAVPKEVLVEKLNLYI